MGKGATVFMIDTCVDKRFLLSAANVTFSYEPNDLYENNKFKYENHGTHVSGIIQTMAPHATLISINLNQNVEHFRSMGARIDVVNYSVKLNSINDERHYQ
jgi:subtilisin family serine protease